jgi:1,4-dihydroxy-2-naphthoate octaprenyltransferase
MKAKAWLGAMRIRTLPLALSCMIMGCGLAYPLPEFRMELAIMAAVTTVFLQILSNLANDYGDFVSGVDLKDRIGPVRALQSGAISRFAMKKAVILFAALSFASGSTLLVLAWNSEMREAVYVLFVAGILAIAAAILYTVGRKPYGYMGLGDVFVFLFFGPVGVTGSFYLASGGMFTMWILLPAVALGLLATAVLNLNNMRDAQKDGQAGKNTLVVIAGLRFARNYHVVLLFTPFVLMTYWYAHFNVPIENHFYLVVLPIAAGNALKVFRTKDPAQLDPELKKIALATFAFSVLCVVGAMG